MKQGKWVEVDMKNVEHKVVKPNVQLWTVVIAYYDRPDDVITNVTSFGPIADSSLLGITIESGESIIYVLGDKIRYYRTIKE